MSISLNSTFCNNPVDKVLNHRSLFEMGFAKGNGVPNIFTNVKSNEKKNLHAKNKNIYKL